MNLSSDMTNSTNLAHSQALDALMSAKYVSMMVANRLAFRGPGARYATPMWEAKDTKVISSRMAIPGISKDALTVCFSWPMAIFRSTLKRTIKDNDLHNHLDTISCVKYDCFLGGQWSCQTAGMEFQVAKEKPYAIYVSKDQLGDAYNGGSLNLDDASSAKQAAFKARTFYKNRGALVWDKTNGTVCMEFYHELHTIDMTPEELTGVEGDNLVRVEK